MTFLYWILFIRHITNVNCRTQLAQDVSTRDENVDISESGEYLLIFGAVAVVFGHILQSSSCHERSKHFYHEKLREKSFSSSQGIRYNFHLFVFVPLLNASRLLVALRPKRMEFQLEKSISSHDQGETPEASHKNSRHRRHHERRRRHDRQKKKRQLGSHTSRQQAHQFNPFETDYVDFGAVIGQNGAFSWHANYLPD